MKLFKSVFGVLAAASMMLSVSAFAQENANRDENGNKVRGPYETNGAWDNVFVGAAIGANSTWNWTNIAPNFNFVTVPGLAVDLYVGKWFTPAVGARFGYYGASLDVFSTKFHTLDIDLLWDITTSIDGYKQSRVWSFIPYFRAAAFFGDRDNGLCKDFGFGAGMMVKWHPAFLGEKWNIVLDNRAFVLRDEVAMHKSNSTGANAFERFLGNYTFPFALTIGANYTFGKTGFQRHSSVTPAIIPVPFTTEQYEDLSGKVAQLEKENAALKDKVAALEKEVAPLRQLVNGQTYLFENGTFTAIDTKAGAPLTLYFDCGSAVLSAREKAHLEYFLDNVLTADTKLAVDGYADKQTGTARRNQQLSEQRVKTVVKLLTKAGVKEENIETAAHGSSIQLFKGAVKNRVVTIQVK